MTRHITAILAIAVALVAAATTADAKAYLCYSDGVTGDAPAEEFEGCSEIGSLQFGAGIMERGAAITPNLSEFSITKDLDSASADLFVRLISGEEFPSIDIAVVRPTGEGLVDVLLINMVGVEISGYSVSSGGDVPSESVSLAPTRARIVVYRELDDHSTEVADSICVNYVKGTVASCSPAGPF